MLNRIVIFLLFILQVFILSSCNFTPKYKRDNSVFDDKSEYENILESKVSVTDLDKWWEHLNDPVITKLVKQLVDQNLTLKSASERVFQARELAKVKGAARVPSISLENSVSGTKLPQTDLQRQYGTGLVASWQIDLFGKLSSAKNAAAVNALALEYDLQGITQTLIAELVNLRVNIYLTKNLLSLAQKNLNSSKKLYDSLNSRYNNGARGGNLSDLYLAQTNYESSKRDVFLYNRQLANEIYKLEALLSQMPGSIKKSHLFYPIKPPISIRVSAIPVQLLDNRPDLKSAEIKIIAANADIGIAIADLFPDLTISAGINYSSNDINKLFSSSNMFKSISAKILTRLFAGGALKSNVKIKESKARELSLNYTDKIINAVAEVESNLKSEREIRKDYEANRASLKLFTRNEKHSQVRYMRGIESFSSLLENKRKLYNANKLFIESERALWKARIALNLSLGGDWLKKN